MENYEAVRKALLANRANTLALLGCLRETLEERPFREAEDALARGPWPSPRRRPMRSTPCC